MRWNRGSGNLDITTLRTMLQSVVNQHQRQHGLSIGVARMPTGVMAAKRFDRSGCPSGQSTGEAHESSWSV